MSDAEHCPQCGHAGSDHHVTAFRGKVSISMACLGCHPFMGRAEGPCSASARYKPDGWTVNDMKSLTVEEEK